MKRVNLFPNPRCVDSGTKPVYTEDISKIIWQYSSLIGFGITSDPDGIGAIVIFKCDGLDPGSRYVLDCEVGYWNAGTARGSIISVETSGNTDGIVLANISSGSHKPTERHQTLRFTAPDNGVVYLKFRGPNPQDSSNSDMTCAFYDIQLELASTFDAAVAGGGGFGSSPGTRCREAERSGRAGDAR
ncbi:hypothetical protein [Bifidobacterium phasiani]|uniref:Uncharacterized protein n=1 Tax=Bifidobacterium phasiani TaxID=2834431 RepID=A0ABS6W627_9BIFI|nr:hypothetical protein [Bifidobacterium phasiani]MBW3081956.1 hypothetical protein [Bifidobacterium phasiani]